MLERLGHHSWTLDRALNPGPNEAREHLLGSNVSLTICHGRMYNSRAQRETVL
jgi:hypothetical protein